MIIVGLQEYMMIEKTLNYETSINYENMELLQRRKEIMKLQSELIKERNLLDTKLDNNIVHKLQLEKRKMIILPIVQLAVRSNSQPSSPENLVKSLHTLLNKLRSLFPEILENKHQKLQGHCSRMNFLMVICYKHLGKLMKINKI